MFAVALFAALLLFHATDLPPGAVLRLGDTRFRAGGEVRHLHFSHDGRTLHSWVGGTSRRLVPVSWDAVSGIPVPTPATAVPPSLPDHVVPAARLTGNRVVTVGPGRVARVWDADTRKEVAELVGHAAPIIAVAASADGLRLATGSTDGVVRMWDAETFQPLQGTVGIYGAIRKARVSANGTRVLTTGDDGSARVWDLTTGRHLRAFRAGGTSDFSPDGAGVIVQAGGTMAVRDVVTGLEIVPATRPAPPTPTLSDWFARFGLSFEFSPNLRSHAVAGDDGTIALRESATGNVRRTLAGQPGAHILGFTPDGTRLLTSGNDHTVLVWDMRLHAMPLPDAIKKETSAAKLWTSMTTGKADAAYLAMARLAAEPPAAVKMARLRLKPARWSDEETVAARLADTRAVELLESLGTPAAKAFLKELAEGNESAWLTCETKRALEQVQKLGYNDREK